jgi:hypothetical protein
VRERVPSLETFRRTTQNQQDEEREREGAGSDNEHDEETHQLVRRPANGSQNG